MDLTCPQGTVQAGGGSGILWGVCSWRDMGSLIRLDTTLTGTCHAASETLSQYDWRMAIRASRSATIGQTFPVGERSGKSEGQDTSKTFSVLSNVRIILKTRGRALSCCSVEFRRRGYRDMYPRASHIITPSVIGQYDNAECMLAECIFHDLAKHGCEHHETVNRISIRLK
ncbi:hypothetical protein TNCV_2361991 [Trichonephila clavipes]|nr:hypothetical protein TNCV_2361991 [Trichonephila clavipes]